VIQYPQTTQEEITSMPAAIIVHGGAGTVTPDRAEGVQQGCKEAVLLGWNILQAGGSALDAVEAAVRSLEDNPMYNAGTGACLTSEGNIELDAGIMEGHTPQVGAVACIELIKNPISLARRVLESQYVLLVGKGAEVFAQEQGIPQCSFEDLLTERQYHIWLEKNGQTTGSAQPEPRYHRREVASLKAREEKHGTVGAVAIDMTGRLAAATSTGGIPNQHPGRVGDTPLIGCGFYADDHAAVSCTGDGEDFMRLLIAKRAADFVARGETAREAAESAIALLGARATGGLIVIDRRGNVGFAWNSQHMKHAYIAEGMPEPIAGI
jgi:beta-aspartyl-peptidase (threonine type)